jgi:hypothetical protein
MRKIRFSKNFIKIALKKSKISDLSNEVLYNLCKEHPNNKKPEEIIAKVLIIGRVYSSAIERRKNVKKNDYNDDFYEKNVVKEIKKSNLDKLLEKLPDKITDPKTVINQIVYTHKKLTNTFKIISNSNNRSLASKYLHFHKPELFFIYDRRAKQSISRIIRSLNIRSLNEKPEIKPSKADMEYLAHCRRCFWLRDKIKEESNMTLNPREIDKILLYIQKMTKKKRIDGML